MNKTVAVIMGVVVIVGIIAVTTIGGALMGMNNDWVTQENNIQAQYKENQNSYDTMFKKVLETAQVPSQYAKDLKEVYTSALQGRYGQDGSKAVFQMLQEKNPDLDPSMYKQVQQVIEASRESFSADQKTLVDKTRVYKTSLQVFPGSLVAGFLGFPRIDLAKYDIITSEETSKAFETKQAAPLNVFKQ